MEHFPTLGTKLSVAKRSPRSGKANKLLFHYLMKKKYYQLTPEQRYQIQELLSSGHSQRFIADQIRCDTSTIWRELNRNVPKRGHGAKAY